MYKVLLVDDEPLITKGLKVLLNWEDYGFEVVAIAENGIDALDYIKDHPVDLLITDIMMPKMNGLDLIKHATDTHPHMKFIVLSGYQEFDYVKQGIRLGIENYLLKPVDEEELIRTVQAVSKKLSASLEVPTYDQASTTLKDNTLWRLLNGEIYKGDWEERLSLYDMDVYQSFYGVSILHFENDQDAEQSKRVREYIETNDAATCLYNPDQELMIIFAAINEEEIYQYNQQLAIEYLNRVQDEIGDYYLSVGEPVSAMEDLEDSYMKARELTLYQADLEPNTIITSETNIDRSHVLKTQQEMKNAMAKRVMKSIEDIVEGVQLFNESLQIGQSYVSYIVVRKYTIDMISHLHHSLKIDEFYNHTTSIEKLIYASTIDEMIEILQNYCVDLFNEIHNKSDERSPIVQDVLEYIHHHYDQELSLKTLSQRFYVNPIYLGQLFQKEIGVVFSEYINHFRLEKSKELLKNTHLRAGEIGKQVGYSDTTYFYKQFKKNVGVTPTEWRNM